MNITGANLCFRDAKDLIKIFLAYAILVTPVLYPGSMAGQWRSLINLSPISPLLEAISGAIVQRSLPGLLWVGNSVVLLLILLTAGYGLFKQLKTSLAERI